MITSNMLKELAGNTIYGKGEDIFLAGDVLFSDKVTTENRLSVKAQVQGTSRYQVELFINDEEIVTALCSCPAFNYQPICKHCIATALACLEDSIDFSKAPTRSAKPTKRDIEEQQLQEFFLKKSPAALTDILLGLIARDRVQWQSWAFRAQYSGQDLDKGSLKKLITKAFPKKHLWEYSKVAQYFEKANTVIKVFLEHLEDLEPDDAFTLALSALDRLNMVLQDGIDDSGGYRYAVETKLCNTVTDQFILLPWNARKKALWLKDAQCKERDIFPNIPIDFALTADENQAFLAVCQQAFDAIDVDPDYSKRKRNPQLEKLSWILKRDADINEDHYQLIKVKAKTAVNCHDLLNICQLCLDNDDELSAEDWLLCAKPLATQSHEHHAYMEQQLQVWLAMGKMEDVWQTGWQRFLDNVSFQAFVRFEKLVKKTGILDDNYLTKVEALLLALTPQTQTYYKVNSDAVLDFYLHQQQWEKAVNWTSDNLTTNDNLLILAKEVAHSHQKHSLEFTRRMVSSRVGNGTNRAYAEATDTLLEMEDIWSSNEAFSADFLSMVKELSIDLKQKRNFIALLKQHFPAVMK